MAVCAVLKILNKGFEWSILTACCVAVLLFVVATLMIIVLPRFEKVQKLILYSFKSIALIRKM